ncbi:MAG: hypothetical protein ACI835_001538 [Planctomycetota bacterium]
MDTADLDSVGSSGIVLAISSSQNGDRVNICYATGGSWPTSPDNSLNESASIRAMELADIDRDGALDLMTTTFPRTVRIRYDRSDSFDETPFVLDPSIGGYQARTIADFNRGRRVDIALGNTGGEGGGGGVEVLFQTAPARFTCEPLLISGNSVSNILIHDADADGEPDAGSVDCGLKILAAHFNGH